MKNLKFKLLMISFLSTFSTISHATINQITSPIEDQSTVAITVYNNNLALIKDTRLLSLSKGINSISFRNVSAHLQPETALLNSVHIPITVLEQNFDFDLLTPEKLLEKHLNQEVTVIHKNNQKERAKIISTNNQSVILKYANRIDIKQPDERIIFDKVPVELKDQPTLSVLVQNHANAQKKPLELSYLTSGLSWKADYVMQLSASQDTMTLNGWVTLTNRSGTAYQNAKLQLVAGDINRVMPQRVYSPAPMALKAMALPAPAPAVHQEQLMDYHLYTLERQTSIADNQTKQIALLSAQNIQINRQYLLRGQSYYYNSYYNSLGQRLKPSIYLSFWNKQSNGLGKPLPKGIIRVYALDQAQKIQFVGEDSIDHTAKNEELKLKLGEAFDITADKTQTDHQKIDDKTTQSSYRLKIRNAKNQTVTVTVIEPIPSDWTMLKENYKHQKISSNYAQWQIEIPADQEKILDYTVRVKY